MTYDLIELDVESFISGNVAYVGSDRATVSGQKVIVKYIASKAVSPSIDLTFGGLNIMEERDRELNYWCKIKYVLHSLDKGPL